MPPADGATHVIARLNVGGPAAIVAALQAALGPERIRVLAGSVQQGEVEHLPLRAPALEVTRVPGLGRSVRPGDDVRALAYLVRELRRTRPAVVHTHTAKAGVLGRAAAATARVPARVHTFHGHLLHGYFSPRVTAAVTATERLLARRTDRLVAVGARVRDELLAAGVGRSEQWVVIAPGVTTAPPPSREEARLSLGLSREDRVVAFVGRLTQVKRPDRVLAVARALPDAVVVVAGEGPLHERVRADAPANVRMLGWRGDVERVWAAADVALLTSDNEGMPVGLIEAALCGVPAVTTDVGSAGEVVSDGVTGLVVPCDTRALVDAVARLLSDDELRSAMSRAAAERAADVFSVERMVRAHETLYAGLG